MALFRLKFCVALRRRETRRARGAGGPLHQGATTA